MMKRVCSAATTTSLLVLLAITSDTTAFLASHKQEKNSLALKMSEETHFLSKIELGPPDAILGKTTCGTLEIIVTFFKSESKQMVHLNTFLRIRYCC